MGNSKEVLSLINTVESIVRDMQEYSGLIKESNQEENIITETKRIDGKISNLNRDLLLAQISTTKTDDFGKLFIQAKLDIIDQIYTEFISDKDKLRIATLLVISYDYLEDSIRKYENNNITMEDAKKIIFE